MARSTSKSSDLIMTAGLESAFIGVGIRHGKSNVAVYSLTIAVDILQEGGMSREDARNMLYDRVRSMDFGDSTPVWVEEMTVDELRLLSSEEDGTVH